MHWVAVMVVPCPRGVLRSLEAKQMEQFSVAKSGTENWGTPVA